MWRLLFVLAVVAIAGCIVAWLWTGQSVWRRRAWRLGQATLVLVLGFFVLLILGRIVG